MTPTTSKQWIVNGTDGIDSLVFTEKALPPLGDNEVLYRDLLISRGTYPWSITPSIVPGSDGAGVILQTGKNVSRFVPGDDILTLLNATHISGPMTPLIAQSGLGAGRDGTFRSVGIFDEAGVVKKPKDLSFVEAATLGCAGVTGWNALFGLKGKEVKVGDWVLTQGTGGVSLCVLQLAKAAGARVIATTSESHGKKVELLKKLGADYVVNYKEEKEWGKVAKELTGGVGVDVVVDVAGATTLRQSAEAVRLDGMVVVVGFVGGEPGSEEKVPTLLDCWMSLYTTRGIWVGDRMQLEDLCRAIEANPERSRPVVDEKRFRLSELKEAYEYLASGRNLGKVCIEMD